MTEYFVLKKIPTGDTKVPLAEAIADLGFVHIESVAAMLEERKKQKDDQDRATPADPWILQKQLTDCKQQVASLRRSLRIKADRTKDAREAENDAITLLEKVMAERDALIEKRDAALEERRCLNCGSSDYVWYFNNGESAYCSECKRGPAPPPPFKAIPCPSCGRKLMTDGVLSGTCCICGTDLSLPACPHCGHDTFKAWLSASLVNAKFKADGTLSSPKLYFFVCAKCGKEVGTLPLKRDDK